MNEVTDTQEMFKVRYSIQNIPIVQDVNVSVMCNRAYKIAEGWYRVELAIGQQIPLYGMLFLERNELYLDMRSMLVLIHNAITAELDTFNAGHHWRYRGM